MPLDVHVQVVKDKQGYEIRDQQLPSLKNRTIAHGGTSEQLIFGRSGKLAVLTYSTEQRLALWEKIIRLKKPRDVVQFMSRWGSLEKSAVRGPFSVERLLDRIAALRRAAEHINNGDDGWSDLIFQSRFNIQIGPGSRVLLFSPDLIDFATLEMCRDLNETQMAVKGVRRCAWCHDLFFLNRRSDAKYCSPSHKNLASRARVNSRVLRELDRLGLAGRTR